MRVIVHHYADVHNYGDVLFPRIVSMVLRALHPRASVDFCSATDSDVNGVPSPRLDRETTSSSYDLAVMGGGEVVHRDDDLLRRIYRRFQAQAIDRPTDVVYSVADRRAMERVWLGVGVPALSPDAEATLRSVLPRLTRVSVRGRLSADVLSSLASAPRPSVIPDLGWLIPRLAQHEGWSACPAVEQSAPRRDYVVVHTTPSTRDEHLARLAGILTEIRRVHGLAVILMGLGDCWGDSAGPRRLQDSLNGEVTILDDSVPFEVRGAVILGAAAYIGQSMHGAITAMSAGRPALVVPPVGSRRKFQELFHMMGQPDGCTTSWPHVLDRIDETLATERSVQAYAVMARERIDSYVDANLR